MSYNSEGNSEGTIYDLIAVEEQRKAKPARYISKFKDTVKIETIINKDVYKTMGQAKVPVPTTDNYLKKHSKEPVLPTPEKESGKFSYGDEDQRKPPIPSKDDVPLMGIKTTKNFITTNAVQNITSVPKRPEKKYVDTRNGDAHNLIPSGLEPVYVQKKEFGEVPTYIVKRKEEMERAQDEYNQYVEEYMRRGAMQKLTEEERNRILDGLKQNWEDIHDQYQGLSVVTDTAPKKNKKERMEAQMKQLEKDIEMFEKHRIIYISN